MKVGRYKRVVYVNSFHGKKKKFDLGLNYGSHSVRPLHPDPPILGGPTRHGLVSLSYTRLWSV